MAVRLLCRPLSRPVFSAVQGQSCQFSIAVRGLTGAANGKAPVAASSWLMSETNLESIEEIYATQLSANLSPEEVTEKLSRRYQTGERIGDESLYQTPHTLHPSVLNQLNAYANLHLNNSSVAVRLADKWPMAAGVVLLRCERYDMALYQERLARAVAVTHGAGFLAIDPTDFVKFQSNSNGNANKKKDGGVITWAGPLAGFGQPVQFQVKEVDGRLDFHPMDWPSGSDDIGPIDTTLTALFDVAKSINPHQPTVIFVRNLLDIFHTEDRLKQLLAAVTELCKSKGVLVIGSSSPKGDHRGAPKGILMQRLMGEEFETDDDDMDNKMEGLSLAQIFIPTPPSGTEKEKWQQQLAQDMQLVTQRDNHRTIARLLQQTDISHAPLSTVSGLNQRLLSQWEVETLLSWALGHAPQSAANQNDKLYLTADQLASAVQLLDACETAAPGTEPMKQPQQEIAKLNSYEKRLKANLVTPESIEVGFNDIGSLDHCKEVLYEVITLPLVRPELFAKGLLARCPTGVLLFGPPGTGKTMLAKAVAKESGSNFLHVGMSDIMNKYVGQSEKNAKAVFTLARKVSPCVIFLDEVDSLFSNRETEHYTGKTEALSEFMQEWDGLSSQSGRVLVMAATNRPFDMDEAVIRRLPRRLMVDMPNMDARKQILQLLLREDEMDACVDLDSLARATRGYSGSDLKNLAMTAATRAVHDLLERERVQGCRHHAIPPLTMKHFKEAMGDVKESVDVDSAHMNKLRDWNAKYGEGVPRQARPPLGFFSNDH